MDLTEAFTPGVGGVVGNSDDLEKTDFFDFVVSPQPSSAAQPSSHHCASIDGISDEENLLQQTTTACRTMDFLHDRQLSVEGHHDQRELSPFIKETNNNTLTALPPVSTITGSLNHHHARNHNCDNIQNDPISMEQSDCDYWTSAAVDDGKESACNILLEDLNKYCWSTHHHTSSHQPLVGQSSDIGIHQQQQQQQQQQVNDSVSRACSDNNSDRQNTDGAIYTLTVLNNDSDSMDALDCCKSPAPAASDSWSLRPNLDLDAILNLEPAATDQQQQQQQQDHDRMRIDASRSSPRFHTVSHYSTEDGGFVEGKELCSGQSQSNGPGDNNNDWKLTDQNHLNKVSVTSAAVAAVTSADSAESLLRSALQGKLYTTGSSTPAVLVSSSQASNSTIALTSPPTNSNDALQMMTDHHQHHHHHHHQSQQQQQQEQSEEEVINNCTDEDLILSQLDTPSYRPGDYEKLKSIANEVVESYCSLEPVCNVSATTTTVMYTLDPNSGNLGTITLPADLGQVGTVTVVTASSLAAAAAAAAQQDILQQAVTTCRTDMLDPMQQQVTSNQIATTRVTSGSVSNSGATKSGKKYCRRKTNSTSNPSGANHNASPSLLTAGSNNSSSSSSNSSNSSASASQQLSAATGGSPSSSSSSNVQRKERSLHYCSICSKGFKDKYSVNVHIRTHTGEKPFACSLCGKSFRQKAHLAKHYQTHVAQKPNVASANNNNNTSSNPNDNDNGSSVEISAGRPQLQLVAATTTCNSATN